MLRTFQVTWQKPTTAAYTWFLGPRGGETRLILGALSLAAPAAQARTATQGRTNRPLWRPTVARVSRLGFALSCVTWVCAAGALLWNLRGLGRRTLATCMLMCARPLGSLPLRPRDADAASRASLGGLVGVSPAAAPLAQLRQAFKLSGVLALTDLARAPATAPATAAAQPGLCALAQGWHVNASAPFCSIRTAALGGRGYASELSLFGSQCAERALVARTLVAAWRRHVDTRRSAGSTWSMGARASGLAPLSTPAAQLRARNEAPAAAVRKLALGNLRAALGGEAPFALSRGSSSTLTALRYVQAPLAWAPRNAKGSDFALRCSIPRS